MFNKISKIAFTVLFLGMLAVPLVTTNLQDGSISEAENRVLASKPRLHGEDGKINKNYTSDFETWIDDNIGFRSQMVKTNAKMQFYVFDVLSNNSNMYIGKNNELFYADSIIMADYQHFDLKTDEELQKIADDYQTIADYIQGKGIQLYYFQCWDKHSIYPECFPESVIQYGDISKTDQIVDTLRNDTTIDVISPKQALIDAKEYCRPFGPWCDPNHWTKRGAYVGYKALMEELNRNNAGKYKVLEEDDYDITQEDIGVNLFGGIHVEDYEDSFSIKDPKAYPTDEAPIYLDSWAYWSQNIYQNDDVDNDDTLLVIGDSYFDGYLYRDVAESFHRVIQVWGDYAEELQQVVDYYNPTIVLIENAERCDRTPGAAISADVIRNSNAQQQSD